VIYVPTVVDNDAYHDDDYDDDYDHHPLSAVFKTHRPNIVVHKDNTIYICELTVCHELNLKHSKENKLKKYANIHTNLAE